MNERRTTSVIWRTVVAAGAMLGTPACASQRKPPQEPVVIATPAAPYDGAPKPAPPEEPAVTAAPAPVTPVVAMVAFTVATTPPGADIYLDGKMVGRSPVRIEVPAGGAAVELRIVLEGYLDQQRIVKADDDQNVSFQLQAARPRGVGTHKTGRGFILS